MTHKFILTRLTIAILATCNALSYTAAHNEQTLDEKRAVRRAEYETRTKESLYLYAYMSQQDDGSLEMAFPPLPSWNNDTDLLWSIYFDKPEAVADLLTEGVDLQKLHAIGTNKCTALYYAVDQENPVLVQQLLSAGADPNQKSMMLYTHTYDKALGGNRFERIRTTRNIWETSLFKAIRLNIGSKKGQTNRKKIIESLLAHKADPTMQSGDDKQTPLHGIAHHQYIRNDHAFPLIQLLLDAGASNKQKNAEGLTPAAVARKAFTRYTKLDPDIAPMFAARATFIKAYPGKTALQRLAVELTLHFCSSVKSIRTQALENITAIRAGERGAELQAELEKFLPDFPALVSGYFDRGKNAMSMSHFTHTPTRPDGRSCQYSYDDLAGYSTAKPYIYDDFGICSYPTPISKSKSVLEKKQPQKSRIVKVLKKSS